MHTVALGAHTGHLQYFFHSVFRPAVSSLSVCSVARQTAPPPPNNKICLWNVTRSRKNQSRGNKSIHISCSIDFGLNLAPVLLLSRTLSSFFFISCLTCTRLIFLYIFLPLCPSVAGSWPVTPLDTCFSIWLFPFTGSQISPPPPLLFHVVIPFSPLLFSPLANLKRMNAGPSSQLLFSFPADHRRGSTHFNFHLVSDLSHWHH